MIDYRVKIVLVTRLPNERIFATWSWRMPERHDGQQRTHRQLSKNSSSFRAIPLHKQIEAVLTDPYIPDYYSLKEKGMQGHKLVDKALYDKQVARHLEQRDLAVKAAREMDEEGIHKQDASLILRPFSFMDWLYTADVAHLAHFFALRHDEETERHFYDAVTQLIDELQVANTVDSDRHLPYVDVKDQGDLHDACFASSARARRVSYKNLETGLDPVFADDVAKGLAMAKTRPLHATPFEHQVYYSPQDIIEGRNMSGNFANYDESNMPIIDGTVQFRKTLKGEYIK